MLKCIRIQSKQLVAEILGWDPTPSRHLQTALERLAIAAGRSDWTSLEEVDVPLRQRHLSHALDEACHMTQQENIMFKL